MGQMPAEHEPPAVQTRLSCFMHDLILVHCHLGGNSMCASGLLCAQTFEALMMTKSVGR